MEQFLHYSPIPMKLMEFKVFFFLITSLFQNHQIPWLQVFTLQLVMAHKLNNAFLIMLRFVAKQ